MPAGRLALGLERLGPDDWGPFERFALAVGRSWLNGTRQGWVVRCRAVSLGVVPYMSLSGRSQIAGGDDNKATVETGVRSPGKV